MTASSARPCRRARVAAASASRRVARHDLAHDRECRNARTAACSPPRRAAPDRSRVGDSGRRGASTVACAAGVGACQRIAASAAPRLSGVANAGIDRAVEQPHDIGRVRADVGQDRLRRCAAGSRGCASAASEGLASAGGAGDRRRRRRSWCSPCSVEIAARNTSGFRPASVTSTGLRPAAAWSSS